jgi:Abnormal spindle-like microcephaly-assoc'd, ASPM-SPD-2-Hydin
LKLGQVKLAVICGFAVLLLLTPSYSQTTPAGLQISPVSVDFGDAEVNSESPPRTISLSNPTKSNITMQQVITSGMDFSEKHDCGQTLAPGAQCTIQVSFRPVIPGQRIGNLDVMGSDPASPHFIALTGTGK